MRGEVKEGAKPWLQQGEDTLNELEDNDLVSLKHGLSGCGIFRSLLCHVVGLCTLVPKSLTKANKQQENPVPSNPVASLQR